VSQDDHELPPDVPRGRRIDDIREYRSSFIGMVGLACVPFLVWGAVGVYGVPSAVILTVWWVFLLTLGIVWFMPFPRRLPWVAALGVGAWVLVVLLART
jgi:hypothetical protein